MSLVHCIPAGSLVGPDLWRPSEPFDYAWGRFGCNQLRCGACGEPVRSHVVPGKGVRRYACACQSRNERDYLVLGADAGFDHEFVTRWYCAGHPRLALPATIDGIAVAPDGPFAPIVGSALGSPPFVAPGFRGTSFWVQRLFRLLVDAPQQPQVSRAVGAELSSADPAVVRAATDFFRELPWAAGAEQLAEVLDRDRARLRATPDPGSPSGASLHDRFLEVLEPRLAVVRDGAPVDRAALDAARRALIAGEAGSGMIVRIAASDSTWFIDHAADIVRARPACRDRVVGALHRLPAAERPRAARALQAIDQIR